MIYEKISLQFDISKLTDFVRTNVLTYDPTMVSSSFGGWSVLSSNGDYRDGFTKTNFVYDDKFQTVDQVSKFMEEAQVKRIQEYNKPTPLYVGYIQEVLETLRIHGFNPLRARFMLLKAGGKCSMHRDNPEWLYGVRLHIPILTNEGCLFETEDEGAAHLTADGSAYLVRVNRMHRVVNLGATDRIHFVASVWDTKGVSKFHQYTDEHRNRAQKRASSTGSGTA